MNDDNAHTTCICQYFIQTNLTSKVEKIHSENESLFAIPVN